MELLPTPYDQVAAALDNAEDVPPHVLAAIAHDVAMRRANVESFAPTIVLLPAWVCIPLYAGLLLALVAIALFTLRIGCVVSVFWLGALVILPWMIWRSMPLYRACAISIRGQCVQCRYDLSSIPEALPSSALDGLAIGPRRCPECGLDWPGVPRLGGHPLGTLHSPPAARLHPNAPR